VDWTASSKSARCAFADAFADAEQRALSRFANFFLTG